MGVLDFHEHAAESQLTAITTQRIITAMTSRTTTFAMLRGTPALSSCAFVAGTSPAYVTLEEREQQGHQGNLDSIQKPALRW